METDELLNRLAPWMPALQRLALSTREEPPASPASAAPRVLWFDARSFFQPEAAKEPLDNVCEALSLLASLDAATQKKILLKIWPSDERLRERIGDSLSVEFSVGFEVTQLSGQWNKTMKRIHDHITSTASPSEEFTSVRAHLKSLGLRDGEDDESCEKIPTRFVLDVTGWAPEDLLSVLQDMIDLVLADRRKENNKNEAATRANARPRFAVTDVEFASTVRVRVDLNGLLSLQRLTGLGVRVSHLPPTTIEPSTEESTMILDALRDIAGIEGSEGAVKVGVGAISISDRYAQGPMEGLATAAQHSPTVHTVEVDLGNGDEAWFQDQSHIWKWVAYSIFSRYADHNITKLKMRLERFQDVELQAIRQVLNAMNPLAILRRDIGSTPPSMDAPRQLVASRFLLDDYTGIPVLRFETSSEIAVRVLDTPKSKGYPWWSVILPGQGMAFVHKDDVVSTSTTALLNQNRRVATVPVFPHLHVTVSDDSSDAVAGLIELIGQKTKRIDAEDDWGSFAADEFAQRVLAACPDLEELHLNGGCIENIGVFVTAAEEERLRLRVLNAGIVETGDHADDARGFYEALTDPSHPLCKHLQELELVTSIYGDNVSEFIVLVRRMLQKNRRLLRFRLVIDTDPGDPDGVTPQLKAAFAEFETVSAYAALPRKPPFPRTTINERVGGKSSPFTSYAGLDESERELTRVGSSVGSERPAPMKDGMGCEWTARDTNLESIRTQHSHTVSSTEWVR